MILSQKGNHCKAQRWQTRWTDLWVVVEPLGALGAFSPGVPLLAHAVARLVALLPLTAVRVAAWP